MSKTYLVNLNQLELEALTCSYLEKPCGSELHYRGLTTARAKMFRVLDKVELPAKQPSVSAVEALND